MDCLKTTLTLVLTRHASMNSTLISIDRVRKKLLELWIMSIIAAFKETLEKR